VDSYFPGFSTADRTYADSLQWISASFDERNLIKFT